MLIHNHHILVLTPFHLLNFFYPLNKSLSFWKSRYFFILVNAARLLWAFLETLLIYSSNFSSFSKFPLVIFPNVTYVFIKFQLIICSCTKIPKFDHHLFFPTYVYFCFLRQRDDIYRQSFLCYYLETISKQYLTLF